MIWWILGAIGYLLIGFVLAVVNRIFDFIDAEEISGLLVILWPLILPIGIIATIWAGITILVDMIAEKFW